MVTEATRNEARRPRAVRAGDAIGGESSRTPKSVATAAVRRGITESIRARRESLKVTRAEAARRAGMSADTWERLERNPDDWLTVRQSTVRKMARALRWPDDFASKLATGVALDEQPNDQADNGESFRGYFERLMADLSDDERAELLLAWAWWKRRGGTA